MYQIKFLTNKSFRFLEGGVLGSFNGAGIDSLKKDNLDVLYSQIKIKRYKSA